MRSLHACALCCCALAPCALRAQGLAAAHVVPPSLVQLGPGDTTRLVRVRIPAQPLAEALAELGRQAGVEVDRPADIPAGVRSAAVDGVHSVPDALRRLLAGTGYRARLRRADRVVVTRWAPGDSVAQWLNAVVVTTDAARRAGYVARRSSTATRTDVPLRDVPQAVTVVGRELIADQSMQSMADVVRYVPGVTMGQGEGHRDAPTIRGQSSTADFFVDGVRDDAQYLRDVYNVERVEALKGSNAMIFGRGGGGGVLNRVTKEAQWVPARSLTLEGGAWDHRRATADVGQGMGTRLAGRTTALYEDSRSYRNGVGLERVGINPTAALLLGGTMVRLGYEFFADRRVVDRGVPSFEGRPSRTPAETYFGDPAASRSRVAVHSASAMLERELPGGVMLRNRARFTSYDKFYRNVFPGAVDATGANVNLSAYGNATDRRNLFNQTDLTYALQTGVVRQTLLAGMELGRQDTENVRNTGYFGEAGTTSVAVAFDAPTVRVPVAFRRSATDADNAVTARVGAVYAQDQVELGQHWQAVAGVRLDRFGVAFHNRRSGQRFYRRDDMVSPRAGLVFKPVTPVSLYGTYSVSYLPASGDQFSALTASTGTLTPEAFTNRELGAKWELRPDLALSGAVYRLDRSNTTAPDPVDATRIVQTGRQRTTGWELNLAGNVTGRWQMAGGFAAQRATIVSRTSAAAPGRTVPLVPARTVSLWNRYQVTRRLGAGAGVVHQGASYAAIDNAVRLPAFTRLDGALFAQPTSTLRLQLNLENLLDAQYFPTSHGNNNIMPGAPRTLRMSVTATY